MVSVVILNWNGVQHGLLHRYLPTVLAATLPSLARVVVADNGSTDGSVQVIQQTYPEVQVLPLPENFGFAEGYNRALAAIDTEYAVLLNDDVRCEAGWLEPLVAYMDAHPDCAAVQPKLLKDGAEVPTFEYAGACGGYLDKFGYPYCRGRVFDVVEADRGQYDLPEGQAWDVAWATGACLMVRTALYRQAGGLDARFFAHMEEIDFCWRLRRLGYRLACVPQSAVYHLGGASLPQGNPRKVLLNFRNSFLMMWKNLPERQWQKVRRARRVLDVLAAVNFLLHGQVAQARAVIRAYGEACDMLRQKYSRSELEGFGTACAMPEDKVFILWHYYLLRHTTFDRIPTDR